MKHRDIFTVSIMKTRIAELIYSSVGIEGIAATFAQTEEIIADGEAQGVDPVDIDKILCIKR